MLAPIADDISDWLQARGRQLEPRVPYNNAGRPQDVFDTHSQGVGGVEMCSTLTAGGVQRGDVFDAHGHRCLAREYFDTHS